jgi:ATP-dependent Lhr-like helicase
MLISSQMEADGLLPLGFVANDYVLALWGLKPVEYPQPLLHNALAQDNCDQWIEKSQMTKRVFRDIALISGLVERGYPGSRKTGRQVTISTDLIYDVLRKYEPDHILLRATREDIAMRLTDTTRIREAFASMPLKHMRLRRISPFAVPLVLDIIGSETIKGQGHAALLSAESLDRIGDALLKRAEA